MSDVEITDWDDAYANGAHIEGAGDYPPRWLREAQAFRDARTESELDIAYGVSERQKLDLFYPKGRPKGLVVFIHGGYWLRFDKSYWSHLAEGSLASGWAVCLPGYDLAPKVRIAEITSQIGKAVTKAASMVEGPLRLTGHSAGGHLVTRMICEDTPLDGSVVDRIENIVSISGVHDLRPLLRTSMNQSFQMTETDAMAESPALKRKISDCSVTAWVGQEERPEFLRQSRILAEAWQHTVYREDPGRHHFDVIDGLKDKDSELTSLLVG
ncbi:alpha/beta hydrolase [Rhodobacterales bacterium]|nr:alpha/beta hydrolase [Rhodobacterales bacterium]